MRSKLLLTILIVFTLVAAGCIPQTGTPTAAPPTDVPPDTQVPTDTEAPPATEAPTVTAAAPTVTAAPPSPTAVPPTATAPATTAPSPGETAVPELPEEAIFIQSPGPGSQVTSPLQVSGMADPTFEQNLVLRLVTVDGLELALTPTTIQADVGQRGPFSAEIPFSVTEPVNAFLQVYAASARDGGITHLASSGLLLLPSGEAQIETVEPHDERIAIFQPALGDTLSGTSVHVEGFALASFEQNLVIEILDADGNVLAQQPVTVQAPDLGLPGPFSADIPVSGLPAGPGRVVVRDPSPAFEGDVHLISVEVQIAP